MELITATISSIAGLIDEYANVWASCLLLVNAVILYLYFRATLRQAKATEKIVEYTRSGFEPNAQIILKNQEFTYDGEKLLGLPVDDEGTHLNITIKNLSKSITRFWVVFEENVTAISSLAGKLNFDWQDYKAKYVRPFVLKPGEEMDTYLILRFDLDRKGGVTDLSNLDVLSGGDVQIMYRVKYEKKTENKTEHFTEPFSEAWVMSIQSVVKRGLDSFVIGKWSNPLRY